MKVKITHPNGKVEIRNGLDSVEYHKAGAGLPEEICLWFQSGGFARYRLDAIKSFEVEPASRCHDFGPGPMVCENTWHGVERP